MKKKLLIFTITAGGGHTAASQALDSYLGTEYDITILNIFKDVIKFAIIPNRYYCTDFYNDALKRQHILFLNTCNFIVRCTFKIIRPFNAWCIKKTLAKYKPDCVISVTPLVNDAIIDAAKALNIPFFLIPVDFDPRTFLYGIHNPTYPKFYFAQTIRDPKIDQYILNKGIKQSQIIHTGFVIRSAFFDHKDPSVLKKERHIPENVPVIMILLGAMGSENTYHIAAHVEKIKKPCHILFCAGQNASMAEKIQALAFPPHITTEVIGFTKNISDLMAIADIFITKSGSNSVAEALQMNVPMIIARFGRSLTWEQFNVHYLTAQKIGIVANSVDDIYRIINELVESPTTLNSMKERMKARKKDDINKTIHAAITQILSNQ